MSKLIKVMDYSGYPEPIPVFIDVDKVLAITTSPIFEDNCYVIFITESAKIPVYTISNQYRDKIFKTVLPLISDTDILVIEE